MQKLSKLASGEAPLSSLYQEHWTCGLWVGNQFGVASVVEFLGVAEVEQRTKPSSLDGCPMFAQAYMGRR